MLGKRLKSLRTEKQLKQLFQIIPTSMQYSVYNYIVILEPIKNKIWYYFDYILSYKYYMYNNTMFWELLQRGLMFLLYNLSLS
jgi:hypothetical protein